MRNKNQHQFFTPAEWQQRGYTKSAAYCSRSERCTHEVRAKLAAWGIPEECTDRIIATLKEEKFIDDNRYLAAFVKDKSRFARWGKLKIGYALRNKGFAENQIAEALSAINSKDCADTLRELLQAKVRTGKYKDDYDRQTKLTRFAFSRGFEYEIIRKVLKLI